MPASGTLSLYFKRNYAYLEEFEVLMSSTDSRIASFDTVLKRSSVTKGDWRRMRLELPQSTRYLAIHYFSNNSRSISFDDITITSIAPQPPAPDTLPDTIGPSAVSNSLVPQYDVFVSGRQIIVICGTGSEVEVFDTMGRRITAIRSMATECRLGVHRRGLYIVRVDGVSQKVMVVF